MGAAESDILQKETRARAVDRIRADQGEPFGALANSEAKANASRRLDRGSRRSNLYPARAEKNRLFDTAPGRNDELPADDIFRRSTAIRSQREQPGARHAAERLHAAPRCAAAADATRPRAGASTSAVPARPTAATWPTSASSSLPRSRTRKRSGNFDLADNLQALRRAVNRTIEEAPGYAEANANYGQFAERFRPERERCDGQVHPARSTAVARTPTASSIVVRRRRAGPPVAS